MREAIEVGLNDPEQGRYYEFATFEDLWPHVIDVTERAIEEEQTRRTPHCDHNPG